MGGKNRLFNKQDWDNWTSTCKRMNMGSFLIAHIKINSKWIKGPKVKVKTIRFLEENFGIILPDFELVNDFLDITSKAQTTKQKSR